MRHHAFPERRNRGVAQSAKSAGVRLIHPGYGLHLGAGPCSTPLDHPIDLDPGTIANKTKRQRSRMRGRWARRFVQREALEPLPGCDDGRTPPANQGGETMRHVFGRVDNRFRSSESGLCRVRWLPPSRAALPHASRRVARMSADSIDAVPAYGILMTGVIASSRVAIQDQKPQCREASVVARRHRLGRCLADHAGARWSD